MWYNDLLIILLGFLALLMIVMAIVVLTRPRKPQAVIEKPEQEKILVEKGFESPNNDKAVEIEPEKEPAYTSDFIQEPEIPDDKERKYEKKIEIESTPLFITESIPEKPVYKEPEPTQHEEFVDIPLITPNIIDTTEIEPEEVETIVNRSINITEPDENVVITPNQTFYDTIEEKPNIDSVEQEISKNSTPEKKLPPSKTNKDEQIIENEPEIISLETVKSTRRKRIRKPVIDESNPELRIDLGVETCPHCGSKVPNTIYCINCGGSLVPDETGE